MFHKLHIIYKINQILQTLEQQSRQRENAVAHISEVTQQRGEQTRCRPTPVAFFGEGPLIPPADSIWTEGPPAAAAN